MTISAPRRVGILAGGGGLPLEIAHCVHARGQPVHIVALDGEADRSFAPFEVTTVKWGQVGAILSAFKQAGSQDLVIVGKVKRPDPLQVRPDAGFFLAIAQILKILSSGGDDGVLRAVLRFFENKGLRVIGAGTAAPELVIRAGPLGTTAPDAKAQDLIALGFDTVREMGPHDVGQAVVITNGRIEALEAAEGTDAMLDRVAARRRELGTMRGGVLVKRPKPGQELRIDMPVIGPETVRRAAAAGLSGIAVLEGKVMAADRKQTLALSDELGVFVYGAEDRHAAMPVRRLRPVSLSLQQLGQTKMYRNALIDAEKAAGVLDSLDAVGVGRAVVVARRYVLTVEAGEGIVAMLNRAGGLRQWGDARASRRTGLAVLSSARDLDARVIDAVLAAGLRGVVILETSAAPTVTAPVLAHANERQVFLARGVSGGGSPV
jgi:UDP-2,3-diacylglucosamine hydrolase